MKKARKPYDPTTVLRKLQKDAGSIVRQAFLLGAFVGGAEKPSITRARKKKTP